MIAQDSVLTVGDFCKLVSEAENGESLSFAGTVSTAINAGPPGKPRDHKVPLDTRMWPSLVGTQASNSVSVFELQRGGEDARIWAVQGRGKTLQKMHLSMRDNHCIIFGETCTEFTVKEAKFEGVQLASVISVGVNVFRTGRRCSGVGGCIALATFSQQY